MSDIYRKINELKGNKMCFGTERTRSLLDKLGSPDDKLKIVHIAGTNGKGSIAEYLTRILVLSGKRVGTFTSPAVIDDSEMIRIDGCPVSGDWLVGLDEAFRLGGDCTAFEVLTAGALKVFESCGCEYAVVECGLGGLNDATNAIRRKEVAVISSIGLEHTAILGNTIEEICAQKAGIVKDCPLVVNALQPNEARRFFLGKGVFADKGLRLLGSGRFEYDGTEYTAGIMGPAQPYNAATAIEAAKLLGLPQNAIWGGIFEAKLVGRTQVIVKNGNTYIVDGAHNPAGIAELSEFLLGYSDVHLIFGCLSDKDIDGDLAALCGRVKDVTAVQPNSVRAMELSKIVTACRRYFGAVTVAESVSGALESARGTVVVCGSFTLVKEAINWIENVQ